MSVVSVLSKFFVINTLATILIIAGHYKFATQVLIDEQYFENDLDSFSSNQDRYMVFVSTMDGYVSALNGKTGHLQWKLLTGSGSLLSSSISERPMMRNGHETRLVPSLDGSLYQIDEEGVEPIPIGADTLLSSTVKLYDSSTVVGGRTIESYAIDLESGKVKYICSLEGCELVETNMNESTLKQNSGDVLLIRRNDRVVRLIEMLSGIERWNYSVGQHDLTFVSSIDVMKSIEQLISNSKIKNHVNLSDRLFKNDERDDSSNLKEEEILVEVDDLSVRVHMASGLIRATSKTDPTHEYWTYKFENSVAAVWELQEHKLVEMDLFKEENIIEYSNHEQQHLGARSLYIGRYNEQPYIQPSQLLKKEFDAALDEMVKTKNGVGMPRLRWRPYLYSALSRTRTLENCDDCETNALVPSINEQYPFDGGSYLRRSYTPIKQISYIHSGYLSSLLNRLNRNIPYWKEILAMILLMLATPIIWSVFQHYTAHRVICVMVTHNQIVDTKYQNETPIESTPQPTLSSLTFNSRYQSDFHHVECLGKGGFGVVFKARNILDDCEYAVKRIAVYDSESARERVMREVKALAKLDHLGIVRYYQSWFENPPLGWQESQDSNFIDMSAAPTETTSNPLSSDLKHLKMGDCSDDLIENCPMANHVFNGSEPNNDMFCDDYVEDASEPAIFKFSSSFNETMNDADDDISIVFTDGEMSGDKSKNYRNRSDKSDSIVFMDEPSQILMNGSFKRQFSSSSSDPALNIHKSVATASKNSRSMNKLGKNKNEHSNRKISKIENDKCHRKGAKSFLYIQMQLCKSESLKDWLQNRYKAEGVLDDVNRHQLLDIFHQIVSAIEYVHSQNLMHRDLKPSNIFFAMDGLVKIGDFGLVTAIEDSYDDEGYKSRSSNPQHTKRVGTRLYMSPEQLNGSKYTNKVDIYALGIIFFEMFNLFSTEMERILSLQNLRKFKYPPNFLELHKEELAFLKPLISTKPQNRPDASEILKEELLRPFEEPVTAFYRVHSRPRNASKSFNEGSPTIDTGTPPQPVTVNDMVDNIYKIRVH